MIPLADLRQALPACAEETGFAGDISIYQEGKELLHKAYGYRDIANSIPNDTKTRFGIASGTKLFTAVAVLKLVEDGQLDLSTSVSGIFGNQLSFIHRDATIRQLLCHTSGIFDYYDEELVTDFENYSVDIPWFKLETPSDYWPLLQSKEMKYLPGERVSYSNGGYVFLSIIIEKITGELYRDFLERSIFRPSGMEHTGFFAFNELPRNTSFGYVSMEGDGITNIYHLPLRGGGDGGLYTNSVDLNGFWENLFAEGILRRESLSQLCHKEVCLWDRADYGLGIYKSTLLNEDSYATSGCDVGVGFKSTYVPKLRLNINVLSNISDGNSAIDKRISQICEP